MARRGAPAVPLVASGGIRTGIQIAKAVALGATVCGIAAPFLLAASESSSAVVDLIDTLVDQLRTAMFVTGARDVTALQDIPVLRASATGRQGGEELAEQPVKSET